MLQRENIESPCQPSDYGSGPRAGKTDDSYTHRSNTTRMHVDVHPSMHKPALSHMERTYLQPTHENACPPEALGLPHSVPTVRIPAAGLSAFALTSQWNACARHVARPLSRETTSRLSMSSPHVFPTCLPHPDAEAPSSAERRAERRASRRPHRACSRQRPVRVLTTAPLCECSRQRPWTAACPRGGVPDTAGASHGAASGTADHL